MLRRELSRSINRSMTITALACSMLLAAVPARADDRAATKTEPARPVVAIDNFGKVNDHIYRGGQPKGDNYRELAAIGVKTVVDLRADNDRDARRLAEAAGLRYINLPLEPKGYPGPDAATRFLEITNNPDNGVVYVHCAGGRHRTGSMVAAYRMTVDGWNFDQAYKEMLDYDFYTSRGHGCYLDYVRDYARNEVARQKVVVPTPTAPTLGTAN
jgi:tyrosine-protein phosphatase SIW14